MPPAHRWALIDIEQTRTALGYIIVVTTDVPCHLWMRWSNQEPHIHPKAVLKRGLRTRDDVRFCFTVYKDNEQQEFGDTLIHTFIKEPWPTCETRWFYFHGNISGEESPSTTALFKKHAIEPPPPKPSHIVCETNFLNLDNGYIYSHLKGAHLFKAGADFDIAKVAYLLKRMDTPPVPGLVVSLQGVAPGPIPNGIEYSRGLIPFPGEMPAAWTWFEALMTDYKVIGGQDYFYCYWPTNWGPWTHFQRILLSKSNGSTCPSPSKSASWTWGDPGWLHHTTLKWITMRIYGYD